MQLRGTSDTILPPPMLKTSMLHLTYSLIVDHFFNCLISYGKRESTPRMGKWVKNLYLEKMFCPI